MMRKVDSFGRALWNATAFKIYRGSNTTTHNHRRSFFSRMDLNGKLWFESFFHPSPPVRKARSNKGSKKPSSLDRIFQTLSDMIHAASSPDQVLEQASAFFLASRKNTSATSEDEFMAKAMEELCSAVAFNRTSKKYLMKVAKTAFEEVSVTSVATV